MPGARGGSEARRAGWPALAQSAIDYDTDDDGLIEVSNLAQLNGIRRDPDGNGVVADGDAAAYAAAFPNAVDGMGCPDTGCKGYELTADLDFDTNGNGAADAGDDYYWNGGAGWEPIGAYNGEFHGNGHSISNLHINSDWPAFVGLFSQTFGNAYVHHVGLPNVNVTATGAGPTTRTPTTTGTATAARIPSRYTPRPPRNCKAPPATPASTSIGTCKT